MNPSKFLFSVVNRVSLISIAIVGIFTASASMANVIHIVDTNGKLIGAKNVLVNGQLFDVEFKEGSANNLFMGGSQFDAIDYANDVQFSQALLDTVFVDGPLGAFDSNSDLTFGCVGWVGCKVYTPYSLDQVVVAGNAKIYYYPATDGVWAETYSAARDSTESVDVVYADWALSPASVPVPAAAWLFGSGLVGLLTITKRKNKFFSKITLLITGCFFAIIFSDQRNSPMDL